MQELNKVLLMYASDKESKAPIGNGSALMVDGVEIHNVQNLTYSLGAGFAEITIKFIADVKVEPL